MKKKESEYPDNAEDFREWREELNRQRLDAIMKGHHARANELTQEYIESNAAFCEELKKEFYERKREFAQVRTDVSDDLKSNFRSWETDHDNEEDAKCLATMLMRRHPINSEEAMEIASEWVGYEHEKKGVENES